MRFSAHHVSHVLSSAAGFFLASPVSPGVVGVAGAGGGVFGVIGGGAPGVAGVVGVVGGGGGGSDGSRSPGGTAPPGFLKRRQASAPLSGSSRGAARSAGSSHDPSRMGGFSVVLPWTIRLPGPTGRHRRRSLRANGAHGPPTKFIPRGAARINLEDSVYERTCVGSQAPRDGFVGRPRERRLPGWNMTCRRALPGSLCSFGYAAGAR